jgi:hypothetical protein
MFLQIFISWMKIFYGGSKPFPKFLKFFFSNIFFFLRNFGKKVKMYTQKMLFSLIILILKFKRL